MWMVRAGEEGRLFRKFKKDGIVAIGWSELGDLSNTTNSEEIRKLVEVHYGEDSPGKKAMTASQVSRFRFEFKKDDYVLTYDPQEREYLVGVIDGPYQYVKSEEYHNIRKVKWEGTVSRESLTASTRNTLGAISTLFETGTEAEKEILSLLKGERPQATAPEEQLEVVVEDENQKARELIKDKVLQLEWNHMQELVASILSAMSLKTRVSPAGPDRGRDVVASPDGLMLSEPLIVAEVKHRPNQQIGSQDLKSFIAGLRQGNKGLYVSTGGFTKEARLEAERSNIPLTLVDLDYLVDLIVQYYDSFDVGGQTLLPLTKIYWPK